MDDKGKIKDFVLLLRDFLCGAHEKEYEHNHPHHIFTPFIVDDSKP